MPGWGGGAEVGAEKASRAGGEVRCAAGSQGRNKRGRQVWQMTTKEGHSATSLRKLPVTATGMILSN